MPLNNPKATSDSTSEYQVSALPWVTSSHVALGIVQSYSFPLVTKFVTIKNVTTGVNSSLAVGFTLNGIASSGGNFFKLGSGESYTGDFRIKEIFLSGSSGADIAYEMIAGLTLISTRTFPKLTGSQGGLSGSLAYDGIG